MTRDGFSAPMKEFNEISVISFLQIHIRKRAIDIFEQVNFFFGEQ